jgi:hypothetical protein
LIELEPPSSLPRGTGITRLLVPGSGSEKWRQFAAGLSISMPKLTGTRDHGWLARPASSSSTRVRSFSVRRLASVAPAEPPPTMM